jgi:beta-phosphoglucomutase-like phosphatase (HAD superfamily)
VMTAKPHPAPYLLAMEELARLGSIEGVTAIEDSLGGVVSAKKAGVRCVAVTHSCGREELTGAGADAVVDDLAAMTDALLEG